MVTGGDPFDMDDPRRIGAAASSDVIRLAVAYNDALDRCTQTGGANIDEVTAFFADDAVRIVVGPEGNSLVATQAGKPAIRDGFLRRAERLQQVVELRGIEICGDWVVCRQLWLKAQYQRRAEEAASGQGRMIERISLAGPVPVRTIGICSDQSGRHGRPPRRRSLLALGPQRGPDGGSSPSPDSRFFGTNPPHRGGRSDGKKLLPAGQTDGCEGSSRISLNVP